MSPPNICVVGSVNIDLVVTAPRLPSAGETVTGGVFATQPGGKGANQALAAGAAGARVTLVAAVGADLFAERALEILRASDVDLSGLVTFDDAPTGVALIVVDETGENLIAVASGANDRLEPRHVAARGFDAVLCQLEIPDDTVAEAARQATGLFCLNAAPARSLPEPVVRHTDVVVVNEIEHEALRRDLARYEGLLVVTSGSLGADAYRRGERIAGARTPTVDVVDTVGAGDAFCGSLTAQLAGGADLEDALTSACRAGAAAASRSGAQASG